jgi:hypothetical protein
MSALAIPLHSLALEFTVSQISDDNRNNREPVVSETGLAAWTGYAPKEGGDMDSDIFVFKDGKAQNLTGGKIGLNTDNLRPQVQSNSIVWVAALPAASKNTDWIFREVPEAERDAPVSELRALYTPRENDRGGKWYEETPTNAVPQTIDIPTAVSTNPPPVSPAGTGEPPVSVVASNPTPLLIEPPMDTSSLTQEVRRTDSGDTEICLWKGGSEIEGLAVRLGNHAVGRRSALPAHDQLLLRHGAEGS